MTSGNGSINRGIVTVCAVFFVCLCALLSAQTWFSSSGALYGQYEARLRDVVTFVETCADADDLAACIETRATSEKYDALQSTINEMVDDFELEYLYIAIPYQDGTLLSVISSTSDAERAAGDEEDWPLLYDMTSHYSYAEVLPMLEAWEAEDVVFFDGSSEFGRCYTGCKPLRGSDGETVALICADLSVDELNRDIRLDVARNVALTAITCAVFTLCLVIWLQRNVTGPLHALEKRARQFTESSRNAGNIAALSLDVSDIRANNELDRLIDAFSGMSSEVKTHAESYAIAEARAKSAEGEIEGMFRIAYQDSLTHVKNKAAYDARAAELTVEIATGRARFAIVMVDVNGLKHVNDTYGHENGNKYIVGVCQIVCTVYDHSPVFRVGGDEFVALLTGRDYENRAELISQLEQSFREAAENNACEPWERYSAACGMAEYRPGEDKTVEQVFRRADDIMYERKKMMKAERKD